MRKSALVAAVAVLGSLFPPSATAATVDDSAQFKLPQRWNDDYKPGTRCGAPGAKGTYVTAERMWFKQSDAASEANRNDHSIPVTHKVTEVRTQTTEVSVKAKATGELEKYLSNAFGFNFVHEIHWKLGQTVGPYELAANQQGKLVWGFMMLDATGQDVTCSEDQQWTPTSDEYSISAPYSRYSELRVDDAPVFG